MEPAQLERLLLDLETDRVERTVAARDSDKIGQAICAFANDLADRRQPGVLFVGAQRRMREPADHGRTTP
jgi:ATP-dependent DNA helicase RecG